MISEVKLKHIIGVARECREIARQIGLNQDQQDACFVMGFLHDIGYEDCGDDISLHPEKGVDLLLNYKHRELDCLNAIQNHGTKYKDLTVYDYVLNLADLTIDYKGDNVSIEQRLEDIRGRYGADSEHYKYAVQMAKAVRSYTN